VQTSSLSSTTNVHLCVFVYPKFEGGVVVEEASDTSAKLVEGEGVDAEFWWKVSAPLHC